MYQKKKKRFWFYYMKFARFKRNCWFDKTNMLYGKYKLWIAIIRNMWDDTGGNQCREAMTFSTGKGRTPPSAHNTSRPPNIIGNHAMVGMTAKSMYSRFKPLSLGITRPSPLIVPSLPSAVIPAFPDVLLLYQEHLDVKIYRASH